MAKDDDKLITDIKLKGKRGIKVGGLTLIASKESYPKYRNILVKELGIKAILFDKKKWDHLKFKKKKKKKPSIKDFQ